MHPGAQAFASSQVGLVRFRFDDEANACPAFRVRMLTPLHHSSAILRLHALPNHLAQEAAAPCN